MPTPARAPSPTAETGGREVRAAGRAEPTRTLLLDTAQRLFAERGIAQVSNRLIAQAAGQANNTAVAYHFGDRTALILAISRGHNDRVVARLRAAMAALPADAGVRDHVACIVGSYVGHLAALGAPGWAARFSAQVISDPALRELAVDEAVTAPPLRAALDAMRRFAPDMPDDLARRRARMSRLLIVHTCAEVEADAAAAGTRPQWDGVAEDLIDALTALVSAPPGAGSADG